MTRPAWHVASSPEDALAARRALGAAARYCAGGTALQLGWPDGRVDHPVVDVAGLDAFPVSAAPDRLRLSAFARLEDLRRDEILAARLPALGGAIAQVAAVGVRHLATLGGNVAWGAGDLVPLLLVLDAVVVWAEAGARPLADHRAGAGDDLIVAIEIPLPAPGRIAFEKIAGRQGFAPGLITLAAARAGDGLRVAVGGGPVPPRRLDLTGLDGPAAADVAAELARRIAAPDDDFATGSWRSRAAGNVIAAFLAETEAMA